MRFRRAAADVTTGDDDTRERGWRDRNSANTRFTTEAQVGTMVRYSGEPAEARVKIEVRSK